MAAERYVVLGLASPRAGWFTEVARWSTSGMVPVEFVKCLSPEELLTRLSSGRPCSALLLDGRLPGADRDLLAAGRRAGAAVLVVDEGSGRPWGTLGAAAVLPSDFGRTGLLDALRAHAAPVGDVTDVGRLVGGAPRRVGQRGGLVAVCGPGGTGATVVAAALAQGLAGPDRPTVLLADLARHAEQAVLHDVGDVVPGVQELVDAHRRGWPSDAEVRSLTWELPGRGYRLLLGLRRARHWATLRPRAVEASVASLRRAFGMVVCDVDPDLDGADLPAPELADRDLLGRAVLPEADLVLVVGRPGTKGVHSLVRVLGDLADAGVEPARLLPVVACAPRQPRARAEVTAAVASLAGRVAAGACNPVLLPERRLERSWRDATRLPEPLPGLLAGAVTGLRQRLGPRVATEATFERVAPGSLGVVAD